MFSYRYLDTLIHVRNFHESPLHLCYSVNLLLHENWRIHGRVKKNCKVKKLRQLKLELNREIRMQHKIIFDEGNCKIKIHKNQFKKN